MHLEPDDIGTFVALGGTYTPHQEEKDSDYRWPDLWVVPDSAVVPEETKIELPERTKQIKPGSELTAVIGDHIHDADEQEAWEAIEGFTISNDVTAAGDWPGWSDPERGMITGVGYKLFPSFSPILTEVQPAGEPNEYDDLDVSVTVDGKECVSGSTSELAFSIPELVSFVSQIVPLEPNDVVALGDPGNPSVTLDQAESVTCEIESIGTLCNSIL